MVTGVQTCALPICMLAQASGGKQPDVYKELAANLIGNSHLAAAGIVAVNRAQEHGFTLATAT